MKKSYLIAAIALTLLVNIVIGAVFKQIYNTPVAQAEQRLLAESLGINRGNFLVADIASFPDGATKLVIRDRQGRVGLILSVFDSSGPQRARIEFYDINGKLLRTLDASAVPSRKEIREKWLQI